MRKLRDIIIGATVLSSTLLGGVALAGPDYVSGPTTSGKVCTQSTSLNVRTLPSTSAKVLTQVAKDSTVNIKGDYYDYNTYKTWYYISTSKGSGFVSGDYICIY